MSLENSFIPPFCIIFSCYEILLFSYPLYFGIILQYSELFSNSLTVVNENMKCLALPLWGLARKNLLVNLASEPEIN